MAIINFDMSLIGAYLTARTNILTNTSVPELLQGPLRGPDRGPAVIPPWEIAVRDRTLAEKVAGLRALDKFIDLNADSVRNSNGDRDSKKLFALFNALTNLRTIAEYAASDLVTSGLFKSLDAKLQSGITEIGAYLQTLSFEKPLQLLVGTKSDNVVSEAALGRFPTEYVGAVIQVGGRDDPIAGLTGTEKFTLSITKAGVTDNIVIDLALMTGPLSISNIGKFVNDQIVAVMELDADNNLVSKFTTRFNTDEVTTGQFAFKIKLGAGEAISLSAADTQPSLVLAGTRMIPGVSTTETSFVNKLNDITGTTPDFGFSTDIAAALPGAEVTVFTAEEGEDGVESAPVADTDARAVATDSNGNIYVVGGTAGDFDTQFNRSDSEDVFLSKFDASGTLIYRRLLGADARASGFAITIDSQDNVIVAGKSTANLTETSVVDNPDSFITKFNSKGDEIFTYQVQSGATDGALSVVVDANDDILFSGFVDGKIDSTQTAAGGRDAFFTKLSGVDGSVTFTHQYGTAGTDSAAAIAIADNGDILVVTNEDDRAILRKFDAAAPTTEIYSIDLGALNGGDVTGLAVDGTSVYISGFTSNAALNGTIANAHSGGTDGFVTGITETGAGSSAGIDFVSYVGSAGDDRIRAITASGGDVFVAGHTDGSLPGETLSGSLDGFVAKINGTNGNQLFVKQFGAPGSRFDVNGIAFTDQGSSSLTALGLPTGEITTDSTRSIIRQTTVRAGDSFYISINGGAKRKITIEKGDSFFTLAAKIDRLSFLNIDSRSAGSSDGPRLRIEALRGATIDLFAGPDGNNALPGLGLSPGTLFGEVTIPQDEEEEEGKIGGIFGLELDRNLNLRSKKAAEFAVGALDLALSILQKSFRSLTFDPRQAALKKLLEQGKFGGGPAPAHIAKQIANFQAGLAKFGVQTDFGFF